MRRRALTLTLCLATATVVGSQTVQSPAPILGAGTTTCEAWLSGDRTKRPDPLQMSWVLGYVSAVGTTVKFQRQTQFEWMFGVLDGHCTSNRTGTLADAARALAQLLQTPR